MTLNTFDRFEKEERRMLRHFLFMAPFVILINLLLLAGGTAAVLLVLTAFGVL